MIILKILKWLGIAVIAIVALIFFTIVCLVLISDKHTADNKKHLKSTYSAISLPSSMTLTQSSWVGGNIDTADNWSYSYTTSDPVQSMQALQSAAQSAGYTVHQLTAGATSSSYIAKNMDNDTTFTFAQQSPNSVFVEVFNSSINRDYP